jgi:hypothetical protein
MKTRNKNPNEKEPLIIHLGDDSELVPSKAKIKNQSKNSLWHEFN